MGQTCCLYRFRKVRPQPERVYQKNLDWLTKISLIHYCIIGSVIESSYETQDSGALAILPFYVVQHS